MVTTLTRNQPRTHIYPGFALIFTVRSHPRHLPAATWLRGAASFSSVKITNMCFLSFYVFSPSGHGIAFNWLDADALVVVVTVTYAIAEDRNSTNIRPHTACVSA
jgi:hypothetical protein